MQNIYRENILDHFKNPRNFGNLAEADAEQIEVNTLCGDEIKVQIKVDGNSIVDIKFSGRGCAISQASASILTEFVKNKSFDDVEKLERGDIIEMLGIPISPIRLKCALLSLYAIKNALGKIKNA